MTIGNFFPGAFSLNGLVWSEKNMFKLLITYTHEKMHVLVSTAYRKKLSKRKALKAYRAWPKIHVFTEVATVVYKFFVRPFENKINFDQCLFIEVTLFVGQVLVFLECIHIKNIFPSPIVFLCFAIFNSTRIRHIWGRKQKKLLPYVLIKIGYKLLRKKSYNMYFLFTCVTSEKNASTMHNKRTGCIPTQKCIT